MNIKLITRIIFLLLIFNGFCISTFCQIAKEGTNAQYLNEDFTMSEVKMKNGQQFQASMNYNIVTEKMVFIKDKQFYDLITSNVDTVRLDRQIFIPAGNACYELIESDSISLYARYSGKLLEKGNPAGYGGTSQVSASSYQSTIELTSGTQNLPLPSRFYVEQTTEYRLKKGDEWLTFGNAKEFIQLFPERSAQLKNFIKENKLKVNRPDHMIQLVRFLNN